MDRYKSPKELETVEEVYLTGKRVEQFYSPRDDEMDWYMEALRRDPVILELILL